MAARQIKNPLTANRRKKINREFLKKYPPINRWWSANRTIYIHNLLEEIKRLDAHIRYLHTVLKQNNITH